MNINDLPEELRKLALLRREEYVKTGGTNYKSEDSIIIMFEWSKTPEDSVGAF